MARLAGVASIASGLAIFVCRYALGPPGLQPVTRGLLVGIAAALLVTVVRPLGDEGRA